MLIRERWTPVLAAWLEQAHDDDAEELVVHPVTLFDGATGIAVGRPDGRPMTAAERREVRAIIAAHRAEPLTIYPRHSREKEEE